MFFAIFKCVCELTACNLHPALLTVKWEIEQIHCASRFQSQPKNEMLKSIRTSLTTKDPHLKWIPPHAVLKVSVRIQPHIVIGLEILMYLTPYLIPKENWSKLLIDHFCYGTWFSLPEKGVRFPHHILWGQADQFDATLSDATFGKSLNNTLTIFVLKV